MMVEEIKSHLTDCIIPFWKGLRDDVNGGSSRNLAAALVNSEALTKEDIEELRNYFNQTMG